MIIIADAIAAACSDPDILARLGGPLGDAARAKAAAFRAMPEAQRKRERAMAAAIARAPAPAGLRGIDPSWIEAALEELPARARADLATGGATRDGFDPASVWLARWASAALVPLQASDIARPRSIAEATRMNADALIAWLADVGADQVALALGAAAKRVVGDRVMQRIAKAPRAGNLGPRRAAIERSRVEIDDEALVVIGVRTIAPHTDGFVRRQLAMRLPRTRGRILLFELLEWSREDIESSPTWEALAAK